MPDDDMGSDVPTQIGEPPNIEADAAIDNEIDEFAENAFDALLMDDGEAKKKPSEEPAAAAPDTAEYEDVELDDVIMVSDVPAAEEASAASVPPTAPPSAPPEPVAAPVAPPSDDAEIARLHYKFSQLKAKIAVSSGGV